jgi:hypothetical protein
MHFRNMLVRSARTCSTHFMLGGTDEVAIGPEIDETPIESRVP